MIQSSDSDLAYLSDMIAVVLAVIDLFSSFYSIPTHGLMITFINVKEQGNYIFI